MTHTQTILEKLLQANGTVAVKLRCCDETRTDSWHTASPTVDLAAWLAERKVDVQAHHDAILASQDFLATL